MKYSSATNFDNDLLARISEFNTVESVYGKLNSDIVGGGRPSMILPKVKRKELRKHIETAHKYGIEFNYLLNATCMDNQELAGKYHKEIIRFIKQVKEEGADRVTVANSALLRIIKEQFPDLGITTSVYLNIDTIDKIKHFEKMGADEITLHPSFNRNFGLLKKAASLTNSKLRLIANNPCLHNCPYRLPGHANLLGHSSQSKHLSDGFVIDIYTILCGLQKMEDPAELIMSDWIRPDDVKEYEGIGNLSLKLADRARPTEWLFNTVKAYSERRYEGNLFDIINHIGKGKFAQLHRGKMIKGALLGRANIKELLKLENAIFFPEVYIDNRSLDGFIEHFKESSCENKTCYTDSKPYGECRFCYDVAKKVVKIDENERRSAIKSAKEIVNSITSGRMFGL